MVLFRLDSRISGARYIFVPSTGVHMTPAEYRAKAALLLEQAEAVDPEQNREFVGLALKYLRLADLAEKNANTDLVYETPATVTLPMQQQPQAQQQAQQAAKGEPSEGRE